MCLQAQPISVSVRFSRVSVRCMPRLLVCEGRCTDMAEFGSDLNLSGASPAEAAELQRMLEVEQQKVQFTAQVHNFMDICWDKCVDRPGAKLDSRTEGCLVSCVDRFIDITLSITNRFAQMAQKGAH